MIVLAPVILVVGIIIIGLIKFNKKEKTLQKRNNDMG